MSTKVAIWICVFIGSTVGGYLPVFFGADFFSLWGVVGGGIGGVLGIWAGFKLSQR